MKTTTKFLLLGTLLLGACSAPAGDDAASSSQASALSTKPALVRAPDPARTKVASDVLARVRDVVATGRVTHLGFSSPADLDGATLGDEIPVYYVTSQQIAARVPGSDPHDVLGKPMEMIYPVKVGGVVKSEVMLAEEAPGKWSVLGVGKAETMQAVDQATRGLAVGGHAPPVALVEVHDLGVRLVAHEETGDVRFTAISERESAGLNVGDSVRAEDAFARIAEMARHRAP